MAEKNKYWCGILYPDNMIVDWKNSLGDLLQLPYAYCVHDKDLLSDHVSGRKVHVHLVVAFPNTTTYKHAMNVFDKLSASGCKCLSTCEPVFNIRHIYNYLIHDTQDCKKKNKHLYDSSERVCGNNFDIGAFEQLSTAEKNDICFALCNLIVQESYTNFTDFFCHAMAVYDSGTFEVIKSNSGLFERLCKGNYLKFVSN